MVTIYPLIIALMYTINTLKKINVPYKKKKRLCYIHISSVQFSRSVVSDTLRPHESQHAIGGSKYELIMSNFSIAFLKHCSTF